MEPQPRPSDKVLVSYSIIDDTNVSPLNRLYSGFGHPQDGPVDLSLRDESGDTNVRIARVIALDEDHATGTIHFTGELVGGGNISGHIRPGPATAGLVGKATITL